MKRLTVMAAGPLIAAGIVLGTVAGVPAIAGAAPMDGQCTSMTMTDGRGGPNPSLMTRAGQVGAATASNASDGSMAANCQPAGHG